MLNRFALILLAFCTTITSKLPTSNDFKIIENKLEKTIGAIGEKTDINSNQPNKSIRLNDPYFNSEWAVFATDADRAWSLINQKREIKVAVVDSGIDYNHPDLKNRVVKELGYNFIKNNRDVMDDSWHGTHVSGIIAAEANNNIGGTGIVGSLDVKIIPVKVLDKNGQGSSDIIAKGIKYAADCGADIINVSIGFKVKDSYISEALNYARNKGVFVVAAAGNDNIDCDNLSPSGDLGAFTVSAVDSGNQKTSFSNFGSSVQVAAPGLDILSTIPGGKYEDRSGTSMAAPIVTGIAAMLKAENPAISPDQMKEILDSAATDIMTKGRDNESGYGLVNALNSVEKLKKEEEKTKNNTTKNSGENAIDLFMRIKNDKKSY